MRKMKDSGIEWIGEIPEGWETCLYKYCCSVQPGYPFDSAKFSNSSTDGFPLIRIRDITSGEIQTYYTDSYDSSYIITAGDLLVGMDGDFNVRWWNNSDALLNQRCCRIIEKGRFSRRFLYYVLPFTLQYINTLTYATTVKHLANGDILNSFIAFPPLSVQKNITCYLDKNCSNIDSILSKTRSSIEEYKKLKQAVITQAVTKGVRGEREMKDSGVEWIGEIPKYWNIGKLKYYWISVESGVSVNAADRPIDNPAQYGVLKTSSVSKFIFNPHEHKQVNNDEYSRVTCPVTADCIIVSRMNTPDLVGACGYVEKTYPNLFLPDRLWQISFKNGVSAKFIWYYLNNKMVRSYISSLSTGTSSTMQNISQGQFGNISVCLPDSNEQKEIADYLDAKCAEIDKLIAKKEQLVKELESYKKSLIYEVVTGKREV